MSFSRRQLLAGGAASLAASLAACAAPKVNYYRLAAIAGQADPGVTLRIGVRSVSIPGYLDQSGIAQPVGQYQYSSFANELWAEPLADMLQAVMVEDLAQRLPAATVTATGGAIGAPSDALLEIAVLRFDPDATGSITLMAQFAVKSADGTVWRTRNFNSGAAPAGPGAANTAAAMSALWAGLAGQVAASLVNFPLPPGQ